VEGIHRKTPLPENLGRFLLDTVVLWKRKILSRFWDNVNQIPKHKST
jgi:hypothetical protein